MLGIVKDNQIIPLTTDTGTGAPIGTLIFQYKKKPMSGYLYCNGSRFDENVYPALYMYLGKNELPDYRECVMVGAEQNTTDTIATHDVYTEGEFKDDQLQEHEHNVYVNGTKLPQIPNSTANIGNALRVLGIDFSGNDVHIKDIVNARGGETTHGKQKAVYVYIKATSGLAENQQDNVLNNVKDYVDSSNSYSTEEIKTGGTWIDGKPIYRKVVNVGTLPDKTSKNVQHNIQNLDKVLEIKLVANDGISSIVCNFGGKEMGVYIDAANVIITSGDNFTGYSGYAIIEYTKTTD